MQTKKENNKWFEKEIIQNAYDKIYQTEHIFDSDKLDDEEKNKAVSLIDDFLNLNILDVGCGDGKLFKFIPHNNKIYGLDISPVAIKTCQKKYPEVTTIVGIAETLPYSDNYFDVVFCMGSLEHFMDINKALEEIGRVLKNNGSFIALLPANNYFLKQAIYRYFFPNFHPVLFLKRLFNRLMKFKKIAVQPKDKGYSQTEIFSLFKNSGFNIETIIKFPEQEFSFEVILKLNKL